MSVYTPLSLEEVQAFAEPYGLAVIDLIPIQGGIQNTNFFLVDHTQKQYVLTVFEELDAEGAGELVPVLDCLGQAGVPVAVPLKHHGQAIHSIAGKPAQIAPRLMGEHPEQASIDQVQAIAQAQAKLHLALQDFPLQRDFNRNHQYWSDVAEQLKPQMNMEDQDVLAQVFQQFAQTTQQHPDRPSGFIHSDLFRDNTLFEGSQLNGILDFYELNQDEWLFDIAISINDFCTSYPQVHLKQDKVDAFLAAYQTIRVLTSDEQACLDIFLAMAACRFWSMRLQVAQKNAEQGRTGEDILQKDPLEMRMMLQDRLQRIKA
ncbi:MULTISPECIES: homoserine kinase [unclassified Acinetobacter]|uniref:homoserine kinase n=1 Tax=unclassified Acinetobacter TaxID=196816 RepID=UPI0024470A45|nr:MULTISPECIES: homoserine kinase [unclassified Acinetobacter]MDH0029912.1 homoserine kinase [Acinetobacter sp. GD04021]MDH0885324.1 homoserine kinase [Acinetobacter sp. GD03873]MDH1081442.1 homoserine kinase [Acinetobacter sp. GD03983]MDH2188777.1 homoserine kinase [Acinetobacter sp. GD03645]MDH2203500.1 homoserine kinase [Acinetobacter sp. GD03647]